MINSYLKQVEAKIFEHDRDMLAHDKFVTADSMKDAYFGIKPDQYNLLQLIDYHNTHLKDTIEWGTLKNYIITQRYVQELVTAKMLGHTSIRTTQIYAKVIEIKVSQDMLKQRKLLDQNEKKKPDNEFQCDH